MEVGFDLPLNIFAKGLFEKGAIFLFQADFRIADQN
jgi:hypothetical protein